MASIDGNPVNLRRAHAADEPFLWEMLYEASHSGNEGTTLADVKATPGLARYVEGWGRPGDIGVVAEVAREPVGAVWVRLIRAYGFVAEGIPELAIAVKHGSEGRGFGTLLMEAIALECAGVHANISLSVREDNPAVALYHRQGYKEVKECRVVNRVGGVSLTLLRSLASCFP